MSDRLDKGITFSAILQRISTTADGGWRVAFDLDCQEANNIADLSLIRDQLLQIAVVPLEMENTLSVKPTELDPT